MAGVRIPHRFFSCRTSEHALLSNDDPSHPAGTKFVYTAMTLCAHIQVAANVEEWHPYLGSLVY